MHGTILAELQKYVVTKLGADAWTNLKREAGVTTGEYDPFQIYPDAEVTNLVTTASRLTQIPVPTLLEDFGLFIAPDLLEMYWAVVQPEWRTLDVLEHTETAIHEVVRISQKGATPPYLAAERRSDNEVIINYTSARKLCPVAKGIIRGIAKHYDEDVAITEPSCMLRGDAACTLHVVRH